MEELSADELRALKSAPPDPPTPVERETVPAAPSPKESATAEGPPGGEATENGEEVALVVTSSTHRTAYMRLKRLMSNKTSVASFPEMRKMFHSESRKEKNQLLENWVKSGENASVIEARLSVKASQSNTGEARQELLTVSQMRALGWSEPLGCTLILILSLCEGVWEFVFCV